MYGPCFNFHVGQGVEHASRCRNHIYRDRIGASSVDPLSRISHHSGVKFLWRLQEVVCWVGVGMCVARGGHSRPVPSTNRQTAKRKGRRKGKIRVLQQCLGLNMKPGVLYCTGVYFEKPSIFSPNQRATYLDHPCLLARVVGHLTWHSI